MIETHISRLKGRRFFLAKSGAHAGIECGRYRRGKCPLARDRIVVFDEAIDLSARRLDLRLMVGNRAIGTTEAASTQRIADREAVALEVIDWQKAGLPQVAVWVCRQVVELDGAMADRALLHFPRYRRSLTVRDCFALALAGPTDTCDPIELGQHLNGDPAAPDHLEPKS